MTSAGINSAARCLCVVSDIRWRTEVSPVSFTVKLPVQLHLLHQTDAVKITSDNKLKFSSELRESSSPQ